jgi:hypothetical protein
MRANDLAPFDTRGALAFIVGQPVSVAMSEFRPTRHEHHAIEAKLNMLLGASVYDELFIGFEVVSVRRGILNVHVSLDSADLIQQKYSLHVAIVVESVLKRAVKSVSLHPK